MKHVNRIFRYLYDPEPENDSLEPIVCLAQVYESGATFGDDKESNQWPKDFIQDHDSRFSFTYRTGFNKILRSTNEQSIAARLGMDGFTADTGFGCMIRSAQTLLGNTLQILSLGRDWRRGLRQDVEAKIMHWFADDIAAPFSIHRFIEYGANACDKPAGVWFGPNAASLCISALSLECPDLNMKVYVASEQGGTVYEDSVLEIAQTETTFVPTLILIPQRLGHDKINSKYHDSLLGLFAIPQFMGIAGGRPSSAHYFFARQGDSLFFLDPHSPQAILPLHQDLARYTPEDFESVHTARVRKMLVEDMDPSMLIGFLVKDKSDWEDWKTTMTRPQGRLKVATVMQSKPQFARHESEQEYPQSDVILDEEGLQ